MSENLSSAKVTAFLEMMSGVLAEEAKDPEAAERVKPQQAVLDQIHHRLLKGEFDAPAPVVPVRRARRTDPKTSHEAATPTDADATFVRAILRVYLANGPSNSDDCREKMREEGIHVSDDRAVGRRTSDLKNTGLLETVLDADGRVVKSKTRLNAMGEVLRITSAGRRFINA